MRLDSMTQACNLYLRFCRLLVPFAKTITFCFNKPINELVSPLRRFEQRIEQVFVLNSLHRQLSRLSRHAF